MSRRTRFARAAATVAIVLTAVALLAVTLLRSVVEIPGLWSAAAHQQRSLDFELFNGWVSPSVWYAPWTNTFGNILLFMPVGILSVLRRDAFSPTAVRPPSRRTGAAVARAAATGFVVSLAIEVVQFVFALGYSDVDDLLFNTVGATLGGWLAATLDRRGRWITLHAVIAGCLAVVGLMGAEIPHVLAQAGLTTPTL